MPHRHASVADFLITQGDAESAFALAEQIPEFDAGDGGLDLAELSRRLSGRSALVLIGSVDDEPVGFKAGYDRDADGSWYSWIGGVLPGRRSQGVAVALLEAQETWAIAAGFERIYVKTRNGHRGMLRLLVKRGYDILQVDPRDLPSDNRLLLSKRLRTRD